jgi:hypothetical protein
MFSIGRFKVQSELLIYLILIVLFLSACQQQVPPENKLEGIWRNGVIYVVYREDGTYAIAELPGNLEKNPSSTGTYTFDGEHLTIFENQPSTCWFSANYRVFFQETDQATYYTVQDSCVIRERYLTCCLWRRYEP